MTGKDKATISVTKKFRIAKLLHTNSASDFDGTNSYSQERIFNYASLAMSKSPAFSNILQLPHFDLSINFLSDIPSGHFCTVFI